METAFWGCSESSEAESERLVDKWFQLVEVCCPGGAIDIGAIIEFGAYECSVELEKSLLVSSPIIVRDDFYDIKCLEAFFFQLRDVRDERKFIVEDNPEEFHLGDDRYVGAVQLENGVDGFCSRPPEEYAFCFSW